jgi:lipopolysaccharide transport system ATP-binding protein
MSDVIIAVENLGKKYRIRHNAERQRYVALRDVLAEKAKNLFRRSQKSEIRNQKSDGGAGVSPAPFGDPPKETMKPSSGGTPAEGNRDGRAPQASPLRNDAPRPSDGRGIKDEGKGLGQGEVSNNSQLSTLNSQSSTVSDSSLVTRHSSEDFWALKDVSFEIKRGEVVGIIGRNGAGKSTLLKILSRITEPSEGRVTLRGRVASLLEVGTGFHPELTGRENVFLNGAILGMSRAEIRKKFDEIVAFAEVEKFLDTPVKRYSSGMYVRLAFAVAAHLEPEILIVDEVLAVGDAEFQKKCLGKMQEVSKDGRTVLFVSHNMAAISSLTTHGIVLNKGEVLFDGPTDQAFKFYTQFSSRPDAVTSASWGRGTHTTISSARLLNESDKPTGQYTPGKPLRIAVDLETDGNRGLSLEAFLLDSTGARLGMASLYQFHGQLLPTQMGLYTCILNLEPLWLASGRYSFELTTSEVNSKWDHFVKSAIEFDVVYSNPLGLTLDFKQTYGFGSLALLSSPPATFEKRLYRNLNQTSS